MILRFLFFFDKNFFFIVIIFFKGNCCKKSRQKNYVYFFRNIFLNLDIEDIGFLLKYWYELMCDFILYDYVERYIFFI